MRSNAENDKKEELEFRNIKNSIVIDIKNVLYIAAWYRQRFTLNFSKDVGTLILFLLTLHTPLRIAHQVIWFLSVTNRMANNHRYYTYQCIEDNENIHYKYYVFKNSSGFFGILFHLVVSFFYKKINYRKTHNITWIMRFSEVSLLVFIKNSVISD